MRARASACWLQTFLLIFTPKALTTRRAVKTSWTCQEELSNSFAGILLAHAVIDFGDSHQEWIQTWLQGKLPIQTRRHIDH
jgi:hypothetical protein